MLFDEASKTVRLACIAPAVLEELEKQDSEHSYAHSCTWHPEYGSWMVEATPGHPYGRMTSDLRSVEPNMAFRRARITAVLAAKAGDVRPVSSVAFPLMGVGQAYLHPPSPLGGFHSRSAYFSDMAISPHPRFGTLTANIRRRRGERVSILLPLFRDEHTDMSRTVLHLTEDAQHAEQDPPLHHFTTAPPTENDVAKRPSASGAAAPAAPPAAAAAAAEETTAEAPTPPSSTPKGPPVYSSAADRKLDEANDVASLVSAPHLPRGWVHADAMGFGMGCCCLQVTFQARDIQESRFLYDQLGIMAPILLALTANTPIFKGRLVNTDTRWDIIAAAVDCRTSSERQGRFGMNGVSVATEAARAGAAAAAQAPHAAAQLQGPVTGTPVDSGTALTRDHGPPFEHGDGKWAGDWPASAWQSAGAPADVRTAVAAGVRKIPKSRYDSISLFMSNSKWALPALNDVDAPIDQAAYNQLVQGGVDDRLAQHVAHLFIRDPLVLFDGAVEEVDDTVSTEHFENLQSTNWHSVRWKPPPPDKEDIGWRVEIRTMEVQLTDYENAAFTVFTVLASRVILFFDLNMYLPMSLVQENFDRARQPGAVTQGKFWFRRDVTPLAERMSPTPEHSTMPVHWEEMTLQEVLMGKGADSASGEGAAFPGLIPLILAYLDIIACDAATKLTVEGYLRLVADRARGIAKTGAQWTRDFVRGHAEYKGDSVVTPLIAHDLLKAVDDIATGRVVDYDLLGAAAELQAANAAAAAATGTPSDAAAGESSPRLSHTDSASSDALLRGASFAEQLRTAEDCKVLASLVSKYHVQQSFADTPSFLPASLFKGTTAATSSQ